MSNVKFLRGPQSNLDNLSVFTEGAFYVTTDTDRLYFAQNENELVYLNKHIINVDNINGLPDINVVNPYDFYYAQAENVLCTKLLNATQWTQINKNTDTYQDTFINDVSFVATVDEGKNIVVSYVIGQKTTDQSNADVSGAKAQKFDGSFTISKDLIGQVQVISAVDVNATIADGKATIKANGVGAAGGADAGFTIMGDSGVEISGSDDQIVISGQTYSLSSGANTTDIALKNKNGGEVGKIAIKAGTGNNGIVVNGNNANEIVIAHKDYTANSYELNDQNLVNSSNPELAIISGVTLENGHVTEVKTKNVKLTADKISGVALNDNNNLVISVADANNASKYEVTTDEVFGYTAGNGFVAIGGNLNNYYYKKEEIDNKFKSANALTFKGGVKTKLDSSVLDLPITNVSIGDVYVVEADGVYNGINAIVGDLFIAYSDVAEDENGYILLNNLEWTHVPSGNETIYTYDLGVNTDDNAIVLSDNANSSDKIILTDDNVIKAAVDGNNGNKIHFSHAQVTVNSENKTDELAAGDSFAVVTGVTANGNGHVTNKEYTTFTLPGENKLTVVNGVVTLANAKNANLGQVTLNGGNMITRTGNSNVIAFNHNTVADNSPAEGATNKSLKENAVFKVVDKVVRDEYGHVTSIETKEVTLQAVNKFTQDVNVSNANGKSTLTIATDVRDSNNAQVENAAHTITVQSESLNISKANNVIVAEIKWGSF